MDSIIDHSEQDTSGGRLKALVKASLIAVSADIFLIILKAVLAKITGSAVLLADAWHSGGDFAVSFTVLLSILIRHKLSHIPWAKHAEGIVALLISLVLILGSLRVVSSVFSREAEGFTLQCGIPLVIAILGISAACVVAFEMYRYKKRIGERYKSIAFLAESDHTHSDYFSSFGVFLTLIIGYFGIHIERITTFFVGILIFRIGALLFFKALNFFGINFKSINNLSSFIPSGLSGTYKRISVLFGIIFSPIKRLFEKIPLTEKWIAAHKKIIIFSTIILVLLLYLGTGFYSVMPYQTGVELLFGRVIELNAPGAHFHAPQPFGNNIKVDTEVYARVECGYRTVWDFIGKEPEAYLWEYTHSKGRYIKVTEESISITGDENLIDANFLCYYKITDPVQYAMNNENAHELLRSVFCAKVHNIIGQYHLDSLLTTGRRTVQDHIFEDLRKTVNMIPLGLEIISVYLEETHPPLEVVPQYRAVASARERKNEIIHQASAYSNDLLPVTRGKAESQILMAEAEAVEKRNKAAGEAAAFINMQKYFGRYSAVQRNRLWWESIEKNLSDKSLYLLPENAKKRFYPADAKLGVDEE